MDGVLVFLFGLAAGAYLAEDIRKVAPILEPKKKETTGV